MWFDVIGNTLAFIGSVIFSAGLLRTSQQIKDENKMYLDANPYTTHSGLSSRGWNVLAFFLIVTGFAITLGGDLVEVAGLNIIASVVVVFLMAVAGYLGMWFIYLVNKRQYEAFRLEYKKGVFYSSLRSIPGRYRNTVIGQHNEAALFDAYKPGTVESLKEKLSDIPAKPEAHMTGIIKTLSRKKSAKSFVEAVELYLADTSNE